MTNKDPERANPPRMSLEAVVEAREALVRKGLVADSGRRKFCKQTGRCEIVWGIAPGARFVFAEEAKYGIPGVKPPADDDEGEAVS
jgi:hypothetical protein